MIQAPFNKVIVRISQHNKGEISKKTGITILSPTAITDKPNKDDCMAASTHTERYGIVVSSCKEYVFIRSKLPGWNPDSVETEEGDAVLFDYMDSINTPSWYLDGEEYKTLDYLMIRVIKKPDGKIVMPNGYVLLEIPVKKHEGLIITEDKKSMTTGIVRYYGKPNKFYLDSYLCDGEEGALNEGDLVHIDNPYIRYAELLYHARMFDKEYRIIQQHEILGKYN